MQQITNLTRKRESVFYIVAGILVCLPFFVMSNHNLQWQAIEWLVWVFMLLGFTIFYYHLTRHTNSPKTQPTDFQRLFDFNAGLQTSYSANESLTYAGSFITQHVDCDLCFIATYQSQSSQLTYHYIQHDGQKISLQQQRVLDSSFEGQLLQQGDYITQLQPITLSLSVSLDAQSGLGVLLKQNSDILGMIVCLSADATPFPENDVQLVRAIAQNLSIKLSQQHLQTQNERSIKDLELVNQSFQNLLFNLDNEAAIHSICSTAMTISDADRVGVFILNDKKQELELLYGINLTPEYEKQHRTREFNFQNVQGQFVVSDVQVSGQQELRQMGLDGQFRGIVRNMLMSGEAVIGALELYYNKPKQYRQAELDMLQVMANQVAVALENADLLQALEIYASEMAQLVHLSRTTLAILQPEQVATSAIPTLQQMFGVHSVVIAVIQPVKDGHDTIHVIGQAPESLHTYNYKSVNLYPEIVALQQGKAPLRNIIHIDTPELSISMRQLMSKNQEQTQVLLPMTANKNIFGFIMLGEASHRTFSDREWQFIETATNLLATQIQNAQLYNATREALVQRLEQLSFIETLVQQISQALDIDLIIKSIMDAARQITHADKVSLLQRLSTGQYRIIEHVYNAEQHITTENFTTEIDRVMQQVLDQGETMLSPAYGLPEDSYQTPIYGHYPSILAVPLIEENVAIGVLRVESPNRDFFTQEQANYLHNLAGHTVISLTNARYLAERQRQIDILTQLRQLSMKVVGIQSKSMLISHILDTAVRMLNSDTGVMYHYDVNLRRFSLTAHTQAAKEFFTLNETTALQALQSTQPRILQMTHDNEMYTMLLVPLTRGEQIRELISLIYKGNHQFSKQDLEAVDLLATQATSHIETIVLYEQIRSASNRMRTILASTHDGILLLDTQDNLIEYNDSAEELLDIALAPYINRPYHSIPIPYDPIEREKPNFDMMNPSTLPRPIQRIELESQKSMGSARYIEQTTLPVYDQNRIIGQLLVLRDITEEHELARYRDEITFMLVHDLRSPLGSVIAGLDLALIIIDEQASEEIQYLDQTLQIAHNGSLRLLNLINTLLDVEREQMQLSLEEHHIETLVEEAIAQLQQTAQQAEIEIAAQLPANPPAIHVDGEKIQRVLINLIDNAIDYSQKAIHINANVSQDNKWLIVRVMDDGKGIPSELHQSIFKKFSQANNQGERRGKHSGIGLAYCHRAVEAHGGEIWVAGEKDEYITLGGACFIFTLPIYQDGLQAPSTR